MDTPPFRSLVARVLRAARLDTSLYREVADHGGIRQALLVVLVTAFVSSLGREFISSITWANYDPARFASLTHVLDQRNLIQKAGISTLILLAAWPIWAAGFWLIGLRLAESDAVPVRLGSVVRAVAFAQAPATVGVLVPILFVVLTALQGQGAFSTTGTSTLTLTTSALHGLIGIWILVGTFLAIRSSLRLSDARTLVAMAFVALCLVPLLSAILAVLSFTAGFTGDDRALGFLGITTFNVMSTATHSLEFNLDLGSILSFTSASVATLREASG